MQILNLHDVLVDICFFSFFITVYEKNRFLNPGRHYYINLLEIGNKHHVSHKITELASGLWFLKSNLCEPFAQKGYGIINSLILLTQKVNQFIPILAMHNLSDHNPYLSVISYLL